LKSVFAPKLWAKCIKVLTQNLSEKGALLKNNYSRVIGLGGYAKDYDTYSILKLISHVV
jgi:hypothetical protein